MTAQEYTDEKGLGVIDLATLEQIEDAGPGVSDRATCEYIEEHGLGVRDQATLEYTDEAGLIVSDLARDRILNTKVQSIRPWVHGSKMGGMVLYGMCFGIGHSRNAIWATPRARHPDEDAGPGVSDHATCEYIEEHGLGVRDQATLEYTDEAGLIVSDLARDRILNTKVQSIRPWVHGSKMGGMVLYGMCFGIGHSRNAIWATPRARHPDEDELQAVASVLDVAPPDVRLHSSVYISNLLQFLILGWVAKQWDSVLSSVHISQPLMQCVCHMIMDR